MASSPVKVLVLNSVVYSFQGLLLAAGLVDYDYPQLDPGDLNILDVFAFMGDWFVFALEFVSFNVVGLPLFIGIPLGMAMIGTVLWSVVSLARGT